MVAAWAVTSSTPGCDQILTPMHCDTRGRQTQIIRLDGYKHHPGWLPCHVVARDDDYFFGILHSYPHELWSLRAGSTLEDRPGYSSTRTFGKPTLSPGRLVRSRRTIHASGHRGTPRRQLGAVARRAGSTRPLRPMPN